jgi:dipeptidyl aminopeptidase/acylaminoacyl peptidase
MYFVAGDYAHKKLWSVAVSTNAGDPTDPTLLSHKHSTSSPQPLPGGRVLFTQSSFTSPKNLFILSGSSETKITAFGDEELAEQGKVLDPPESFFFEGAEKGREVQGWLFKPKGWKEAQERVEDMSGKYPVVFWIHGGPQYAWFDEWDNEWVSFIVRSSTRIRGD